VGFGELPDCPPCGGAGRVADLERTWKLYSPPALPTHLVLQISSIWGFISLYFIVSCHNKLVNRKLFLRSVSFSSKLIEPKWELIGEKHR